MIIKTLCNNLVWLLQGDQKVAMNITGRPKVGINITG
jgi:hypothetical protein